jgi:hypothetical protein
MTTQEILDEDDNGKMQEEEPLAPENTPNISQIVNESVDNTATVPVNIPQTDMVKSEP